MVFYKVLSYENNSVWRGDYRGVDREEPFPFEGISKRGMDLWYMYCDYLVTTVTGVIDQMSLGQLQEMAYLFSREGKQFEVVRYSRDRERIGHGVYYGIDIISVGAHSDLSAKYSPNGEETWTSIEYSQYLNGFGLFSNEYVAEKYLEDHERRRQMNMAEDEDMFIVYVEGVNECN